jgi:hypothetical protein
VNIIDLAELRDEQPSGAEVLEVRDQSVGRVEVTLREDVRAGECTVGGG